MCSCLKQAATNSFCGAAQRCSPDRRFSLSDVMNEPASKHSGGDALIWHEAVEFDMAADQGLDKSIPVGGFAPCQTVQNAPAFASAWGTQSGKKGLTASPGATTAAASSPPGKVLVTAKIENLEDLFGVHKGLLTDDHVRRVEVSDALVD